ncbi:hypothetical protein [Streptomyces bauhiniae]
MLSPTDSPSIPPAAPWAEFLVATLGADHPIVDCVRHGVADSTRRSRLPGCIPHPRGPKRLRYCGATTKFPAPRSPRSAEISDPITYGKVAAEALWSYDTRAYSQPELRKALRGWLTTESKYADSASVHQVVPSAVLWSAVAANKTGRHRQDQRWLQPT